MPTQATAAHRRGPVPNTPVPVDAPLILSDPEWDTLAWAITEIHTLAQGAPADLRASLLSIHAAWIGPLVHTPRFLADGRVIVQRPAPEHRHGLALLLRLAAAAARPGVHPTGMVFHIAADAAAALASRLEETGA